MSNNLKPEQLSSEEKKKRLFLEQKHTLDLFLECGAISQAQNDKSLGDLIIKLEIDIENENMCGKIE